MNWEGGVRVPLVFYWSGKVTEGKYSKQVVANYDLLPTFADLLHVTLKYPKDGVSLLPVLLDGKERLPETRYVYVSSEEGPAVIDSEGWKLRYNKKKKMYRLHFLPEDYQEKTILNDTYPEVMNRLQEHLKEVL